MKNIIIILILLLSTSVATAFLGSQMSILDISSLNDVTINFNITNKEDVFCLQNGDCVLNSLNVTTINSINKTNINVTGNMSVSGNLVVEGNITGSIDASNIVNEHWVNETLEYGNQTFAVEGAGENVALTLFTDVNEQAFLYYKEGGNLGFRAWYDGHGGGTYKLDALDLGGVITPKMEIDRGDDDIDFFVSENLNDNNITNIMCVQFSEGFEMCDILDGDDVFVLRNTDTDDIYITISEDTGEINFWNNTVFNEPVTVNYINATGTVSAVALNVSYIYGAFGIGGMDIRASPWWLGGTDLEIQQSLIVDENIQTNNLTVTGDLNVLGNVEIGKNLTVSKNFQLGTATTLNHGINTAPVTNQGVTASFSNALTSGSRYGYYTTITNQEVVDDFSQLFTYGNYVDFDSSQFKVFGFAFSNYYNVGTMNDNEDTSTYQGIIQTFQIGTWNKVHFGGGFDDTLPIQLMYGTQNILTGDLPNSIESANKYGTYNIITGTGKFNYAGYFSASGADANYGIWVADGDVVLDNDDQKLYFGEVQDSYIEYDGNDWLFNPKNVGTGQMKVLGDINVTEDLYVGDDVFVDGDVNITEDLYVGDDVIVYGDVNITEDLYVGSNTMIDGDLEIQNNLTVESNTFLSDKLTVSTPGSNLLAEFNAGGISRTFFTSNSASSFVNNKYQAGTSVSYVYQFAQNYGGGGRYKKNSVLFDSASSGGLGLSAYHANGNVSIWTAGNNERLRVDYNGDVDILDGDLDVAKNFTGNQIYGGITGDELGDVLITNSGQYYDVNHTTAGPINGFAFNTTGEGGLMALVAGTYLANSGWSFSGSANTEYHLRISIDGVAGDNCHAQRKVGTGADVGSASTAPCFIKLAIGEIVHLQIENVDSTTNPSVHDVGMTIMRVGD